MDIASRTLRKVVAALFLVLLVGSCETRRSGAMTMVPPAETWHETLSRQRSERDRFFVENAESPLPEGAAAGFAGLDYWEPDPAYHFVGPVNLHYQPERFTIVTTTGKERPCEKVGWVRFGIAGEEQTLQVYRLLDQPAQPGNPGYFLPFMDATTGTETYPAGRYVDLVGPAGGPFVLDFNTAYNPFCAYGAPERYVCPKTPAENRLSVRIEAGERGYHDPEA